MGKRKTFVPGESPVVNGNGVTGETAAVSQAARPSMEAIKVRI